MALRGPLIPSAPGARGPSLTRLTGAPRLTPPARVPLLTSPPPPPPPPQPRASVLTSALPPSAWRVAFPTPPARVAVLTPPDALRLASLTLRPSLRLSPRLPRLRLTRRVPLLTRLTPLPALTPRQSIPALTPLSRVPPLDSPPDEIRARGLTPLRRESMTSVGGRCQQSDSAHCCQE
nr:proline-rich receptor-like protein kinase PERK2 [Penaeus vannamei]